LFFQFDEMCWSPQEEKLQELAEYSWGAFPGPPADPLDLAEAMADPEPDPPEQDMIPDEVVDPAGDLAGLEEGMAGLMAGPAEPGNDVAVQPFPWHVPEGMPFPIFAPELPLVNGWHIHLPPLDPPHDGME
jgi:hypothetical protein